ncbi:potassium channel family protein [Citricoccus sp.]|uniref:potassium channel family protein n=1 Tax=Citricoccus sp. TaxID=1978372 RepID=UPI00261A6506|nr:potassium channel family protein [Citricoccus sp.]HRO31386.1 potassium channel family protein [Citricoccus sp.]HRO95293.1 potassium channel family protein [Citricoccus sp.]
MDIVLSIAGILVILVGLRDMFHSLLHPKGQGGLSRGVLSGLWKASRLTGHRFGSAAGPAGMVAVILMWVLLQAVGWALVYLPHLPEGFSYSGVDPADHPNPAEALYVSLTTLSTVGFGDVVATSPWIRMAAPVQALTGFALLTAGLTWFTQVYPPLSRRRALALALAGMEDAGYAEALHRVGPETAARVLDEMSGRIEQAGIDFAQHTESYYFVEEDTELSLARQLPYALALRDSAQHSQVPELQAGATRFSAALDRLGAVLAEDFVSGADAETIFAAYADDHRRR